MTTSVFNWVEVVHSSYHNFSKTPFVVVLRKLAAQTTALICDYTPPQQLNCDCLTVAGIYCVRWSESTAWMSSNPPPPPEERSQANWHQLYFLDISN